MRASARLRAPDDLPGLLILDPLELRRRRSPTRTRMKTLPHAGRRRVLTAEKFHRQIIMDGLVVVRVLGLPEEDVALLAEVGHHADVADAGFLRDLASRHGLRGFSRLDRALRQHPLAGLVLKEEQTHLAPGGVLLEHHAAGAMCLLHLAPGLRHPHPPASTRWFRPDRGNPRRWAAATAHRDARPPAYPGAPPRSRAGRAVSGAYCGGRRDGAALFWLGFS